MSSRRSGWFVEPEQAIDELLPGARAPSGRRVDVGAGPVPPLGAAAASISRAKLL